MHPIVAVSHGKVELLMFVLVFRGAQQMDEWVDRRVDHPENRKP